MKKINWLVAFLIFIGTLSWSLTMIKSGLPTKWGIGFWGANGHDGIWHLALIESIKNGFPIQNPLASGSYVTNYHWGFDFIVAVLSKVTTLSSSSLYFQIMPPIMAFLIGLMAYLLVKEWTDSKKAALWAAFFTYFGGSFGWIISFLRTGEMGGESLFWAQQQVSTLINPPYAMSLVVLLLGFWVILRNTKSGRRNLLLEVLIFSPLFLIKSYAAVIALTGLVIMGAFDLFKKKSWYGLVRAFLITFITIIVILLTSPSATGLIQLEPLWFTHSMIESSDRLYFPTLILARQAYSAYHMYHRLIPLELLLIAIFIIGNLGTRILSLFWVKNTLLKIKSTSAFDLAIGGMTLVAIVLPLLFTQKGTTWNTIQFFYYAQVLCGFQAAIWLSGLKFKKLPMVALSLIVVIFTLPTTISTLFQNYIPPRPPASLPFGELSALNFLSTQAPGTVLTFPYEKPVIAPEPPISLFRYESTAYVSAYSYHPSYLVDTVNLSILNYPWSQRLLSVKEFFSPGKTSEKKRFLTENKIVYVYLLAGQTLPKLPNNLGLTPIFNNGTVNIYRFAE